MIEAVIIAMILSSVTLKAIGNAAVDVSFAVRGKESPRYKQAKARSWAPSKPSGPMFKYMSQLWSDSWAQRLKKHQAKVAGDGPDKPRGAARIFWTGLGQDARRAAGRKWDQGWMSLDERRRSRSTRVPDGTQVVPGEVVPDAPVPTEPEPVLADQPGAGTDVQDGTDTTGPTGTGPCIGCSTGIAIDGILCGACRYRQQQRSQYQDSQPEPALCSCGRPALLNPDTGEPATPSKLCLDCWEENNPSYFPKRAPVNTIETHHSHERTTTMTTTATTEVMSLDTAIAYGEQSAVAQGHHIVNLEHTRAAVEAGGVTGEPIGYLTQAMEANATAKTAMENFAKSMAAQKGIQEQFDANPDAGTKEFILGQR